MRSVESIEAQIAKTDFEDTELDTFLVWRKLSIRSEEIWSIAQYDADKCIITMYDSTEYFVKEAYGQLHQRWQIAKEKEPPKEDTTPLEVEEDDETDD